MVQNKNIPVHRIELHVNAQIQLLIPFVLVAESYRDPFPQTASRHDLLPSLAEFLPGTCQSGHERCLGRKLLDDCQLSLGKIVPFPTDSVELMFICFTPLSKIKYVFSMTSDKKNKSYNIK